MVAQDAVKLIRTASNVASQIADRPMGSRMRECLRFGVYASDLYPTAGELLQRRGYKHQKSKVSCLFKFL